jgi:Predicted transmembrane transcriptional regulator (anti-sigma factor)
MIEYFDDDGHLTDEALYQLIDGEDDELRRLEISEHLSFCDSCIERYTLILEGATLIEPNQSVADSVITQIKKKAARLFFSRYGTMAVAACFTMTLWFTGVFNIDFQRFEEMSIQRTQIEQKGDFSNHVMEKIDGGFEKLKGVFDYGEK